MRSFVDLERTLGGQPLSLGPRLARLDYGRGREALYADQLPELLGVLAAETRIASITSSSAIEGVTVAPSRLEGLAGLAIEPRRFRNRNEREFAGYRDAIDEITRAKLLEPISFPYILHLHRQLFRYTKGGGGRLKTHDNVIVSYEKGFREVLFTPPSPKETEFLLPELVARFNEAIANESAHAVVLIGAFILDFLAIHPVADGNGRLARLLTTHTLLQQGYQVTRYVSIEQRMFETRNSYYAALCESQRNWQEGTHRVWPWIQYLVDLLDGAYDTFEARIADRRNLAGLSKQRRVHEWAIHHAPDVFRLRDIRAALPGVSDQTIRLVLRQLRGEGRLQIDAEAGGSGPQAAWRRIGRVTPARADLASLPPPVRARDGASATEALLAERRSDPR